MFCTTFLRICDIMEKVTFDYSMKNIPLPSKNTYKAKLHVKVENVIKRMRWKSYFFHNPSASNQQTSNFGLKSRKSPSHVYDLKPLENDLLEMLENIKFRHVSNSFQSKLRKDIKKINSSTKAIIFADKTRNLYEMEKD